MSALQSNIPTCLEGIQTPTCSAAFSVNLCLCWQTQEMRRTFLVRNEKRYKQPRMLIMNQAVPNVRVKVGLCSLHLIAMCSEGPTTDAAGLGQVPWAHQLWRWCCFCLLWGAFPTPQQDIRVATHSYTRDHKDINLLRPINFNSEVFGICQSVLFQLCRARFEKDLHQDYLYNHGYVFFLEPQHLARQWRQPGYV